MIESASSVLVNCKPIGAVSAIERWSFIRPWPMNVDLDWLRRSLREQLELLAAPGEQALARLPDGCVKPDELSLDFDNFCQAYIVNCGSELSADVQRAIRAVEDSFKRMSGPANAELWTAEAVATHPAWAEVRHQASRALELFGEVTAE
jgi:hypothetical protein